MKKNKVFSGLRTKANKMEGFALISLCLVEVLNTIILVQALKSDSLNLKKDQFKSINVKVLEQSLLMH